MASFFCSGAAFEHTDKVKKEKTKFTKCGIIIDNAHLARAQIEFVRGAWVAVAVAFEMIKEGTFCR